MHLNKKEKAVLNKFAKFLRKTFPDEIIRIILFGSYAHGNFTDDSDIDLLIIKDTKARFLDRWMAVRKILADPKRTIPIETIIITPVELEKRLEIGDQFFEEIVKTGIILYEN